jgi:hypothetical protein
VLLFLIAYPLALSSQDIAVAAAPNPSADSSKGVKKVISVVAKSGGVQLSGNQRFSRRDRVRIIVHYANPFVFSSSSQFDAAGVPPTGLTDVGTIIQPGSGAPKPAAPRVDTITKGGGGQPAPPAGGAGGRGGSGGRGGAAGGAGGLSVETACTIPPGTDLGSLRSTILNQNARTISLTTALAPVGANIVSFRGALRADTTTLKAPDASASSVFAAASHVLAAALAVRVAWQASRPDSVHALWDAAERQAPNAISAASVLAAFPEACAQDRALAVEAATVEAQRKRIEPYVSGAGGDFAVADSVAGAISGVLARSDAFWTAFDVGPFDSATVVTVSVTQTKAGQKAESYKSAPVKFGDAAWFAVSTGFGLWFIGNNTYAIQTVPDTGGKSKGIVQSTVRSSFRSPTIIFGHARLWEFANSSLLGTFGTSTSFDNSTDAWRFLGLSLGVLDERALISVGAVFGNEQRLAKGVNVGDVLPTGVQNIPTVTERVVQLGFALTLRLK